MRGKINVKSELNRGTTFIVKIPVTAELSNYEPSEIRVSNY
jgi:chemotaxis protein histidine kinase CheA